MYLGASAATNEKNYAVAVPFPSAGKALFETTRMVDAGRNANGAMVGRMVGRSVSKQSMEWDSIQCETWWRMNRWFEQGHFSFYCHYFNHNVGEWQTRLFYLGDVKTNPYRVNPDDGCPAVYRNASFNVIDCGVV